MLWLRAGCFFWTRRLLLQSTHTPPLWDLLCRVLTCCRLCYKNVCLDLKDYAYVLLTILKYLFPWAKGGMAKWHMWRKSSCGSNYKFWPALGSMWFPSRSSQRGFANRDAFCLKEASHSQQLFSTAVSASRWSPRQVIDFLSLEILKTQPAPALSREDLQTSLPTLAMRGNRPKRYLSAGASTSAPFVARLSVNTHSLCSWSSLLPCWGAL